MGGSVCESMLLKRSIGITLFVNACNLCYGCPWGTLPKSAVVLIQHVPHSHCCTAMVYCRISGLAVVLVYIRSSHIIFA